MKKNIVKTYAAYYDNKIRKDSSSGGIFSVFALHTLFLSGSVYGVAMNYNCQIAEFKRVTDEKGLQLLRGSKYLQARPQSIFKEVKKDLEEGKKVLFSGTACQVNGLRSFLQKDYPNLLTIDVICHGTPTPKFWQKYIEGKIVKNVNFRCKDIGWENYGMKLNSTYIHNAENTYMKLFLKEVCIRPSCYECVNKENKRSDITLGDFWGINEVAPDMNDKKGTSIIIIRSEKGQQVFDRIKHELVVKEVSYEEGVHGNPSEYSSVERPLNRKFFFQDLNRMSFDELYSKYINTPLWCRVVKKAKRVVKKVFGKS